MRLLVLGSDGFIGKRFIAAFSHKHEIIAGEYDENRAFQDLTLPDTAVRMLERHKPRAVLNLAGKSYHTARDDADIYESNLLCQVNLHEAVARLRLNPRIVFCSSSAVYRSSREPVDEGSPCMPANTYAKVKYIQERIGLSYHPGQDVVIARLFNVIGPRQSKDFFIPAIIERIIKYRNGEAKTVRLKTLNAMRDFIFIDDVCSALDTLIERGKGGETYNVCSGRGVSIDEVIRHVKGILGISDMPLEPQDDSVREGIDYQVGSNRKMLDAGWTPSYDIKRSLEEIIREEYGA